MAARDIHFAAAPPMSWRKIFRVLGGIAFVGLSLLGGIVALGFFWAEADRKSADADPRTTVARELGWHEADNREAVLARTSREPQLVLPLLAHRSLEVRQAAWRCLLDVPLDDTSLKFLSAELSNPRTNPSAFAGDVVSLLCRQPDHGAALFSFFYKRSDPVPPEVQNALEFEASQSFPPETWPELLLAIVRDPAVPAANRRDALKVWGEMYLSHDRRKPGEPPLYPLQMTQLEALAPGLPSPAVDAARETIRRFQRVHTFQRDWPLLTLDRKIILSLRPPADEAVAALADDKDWQRTHEAALQLALNGVADALPSLRVVADSYWYPPVRETTRLAVEALEGKRPELLQDGGKPLRNLVDRRWRERWEAWRLQHSPREISRRSPGTFDLIVDAFVTPLVKNAAYETGPLQRAWLRRLRPRIDEVEYRWSESALPLRFDWDLSPRHVLRFAGGKLLGYNEGEFGAGTIFIRGDEMPRLIDPSHVEGFARMPFGIVILCNEPPWERGQLLLVRESGEGQVTVEPFKRLPNIVSRFQTTSAGELLIDCGMDKVVITAAGAIRMANETEAKNWRD